MKFVTSFLITEILITLAGVPFAWPLLVWWPTPLNGSEAAFLLVSTAAFASFLIALKRPHLGFLAKYCCIVPLLLTGLIWSFQEILFDFSPGLHEYDKTLERESLRAKHVGVSTARTIEEYLSGIKKPNVNNDPIQGKEDMLTEIRKKFPKTKWWNARVVIVGYGPHASGYYVLCRLDSDQKDGAVAVYALTDNSPNVHLEAAVFRTKEGFFVRNRPSFSRSIIRGFGLFRAWEGHLLRSIVIYLCFFYSLVGLVCMSYRKISKQQSTILGNTKPTAGPLNNRTSK